MEHRNSLDVSCTQMTSSTFFNFKNNDVKNTSVTSVSEILYLYGIEGLIGTSLM